MREVACVFRPVVDEVRARGIAPERLLAGLPIELEELGNPRRRISWDDFAKLAQRCAEIFGPDAFEELAGRSAQRALPAPLRWMLLAWWRDVRGAYRLAPFWGPRIFRATRAECEVLPDGRVRQLIEILPGYRESPEFFRGVKGLLRAAPRLFGQADADVELECDGRRGEFLIEPESRRTRSPLRTRLEALRGGAAGGGRRETVDRFARQLARTRGWRELPGRAARLLREELDASGVALSLNAPPHYASRIVAAVGEREGRPATVRPLVFAQETVGSLALWTPGGRPLGERAEQRLHALRAVLALLVETLEVDATNRALIDLLERNLSDWRRVEACLERIAGDAREPDLLLASEVPPFAGTVLLIEDDELVRRRTQRELESQGHAVLGVSSDPAALPLAEPCSGPIRLVVAGLESAALSAEQVHRIARLHPELRGILLLRLRSR